MPSTRPMAESVYVPVVAGRDILKVRVAVPDEGMSKVPSQVSTEPLCVGLDMLEPPKLDVPEE